mgnify:CR=1 FL=1
MFVFRRSPSPTYRRKSSSRTSSASPSRKPRTIPTSPPRGRQSTPAMSGRLQKADLTFDASPVHNVTASGDALDVTKTLTPRTDLPRPSTATLERPKRAYDGKAPRIEPQMTRPNNRVVAQTGTITKKKGVVQVPSVRDRSMSNDRRQSSLSRTTGKYYSTYRGRL